MEITVRPLPSVKFSFIGDRFSPLTLFTIGFLSVLSNAIVSSLLVIWAVNEVFHPNIQYSILNIFAIATVIYVLRQD